jgi:hypothetical protein
MMDDRDFVTRAEFNHLLQKVSAIEAVIQSGQPLPGTCLKGKYRGQSLAEVVKTDPEYVDWLATNNFHRGIGFMEEHVKQARAAIAAKAAAATPERQESRRIQHQQDDMDDDIPF